MSRTRRALGATSGIGSMLIGARKAGFEIVGNIEWRPYYHTGTFEKNFPGAFMVESIDELEDYPPIDLVMGHPECGIFSNLNPNKEIINSKTMDLPLFADIVRKIEPRFFVMDNLPGSLEPVPVDFWHDKFPDYDLFFEWISNWGYGNMQKARNRFFLIGAKKDEKFVFIPGERVNLITVKDTLADIYNRFYGKLPNHHPHTKKDLAKRAKNLYKYGEQVRYADLVKYFKDKPEGYNLRYHAQDGKIKQRFGMIKTHWEGVCNVLTGTNPIIHPLTGLPFSIRERARIQGCPDDFVFVGEILNSDGTWNHEKNPLMIKQTGKFMPVQFCTYISKQIMAHIEKDKFHSSQNRILRENPFVTKNKERYCELTDYSNKDKACYFCWNRKKCSSC